MLCQRLLAEEVEAVNAGPLRQRLDQDVWIDGSAAFAQATGHGRTWNFRLSGSNYNAEPLRLAVLDTDFTELSGDQWPPGLCAGEHPGLHRPFTCMQGLFEYHAHSSHLNNPWDQHRASHRLDVVLRNILNRSQLP